MTETMLTGFTNILRNIDMDRSLIEESIENAKKSAEKYKKLFDSLSGESPYCGMVEDMQEDLRQHAECLKEMLGGEKKLSDNEIREWNEQMENEDGSTGGHWNISQTNSVAESAGLRFDHITPEEWNVTMNMMYSDYSGGRTSTGLVCRIFMPIWQKPFFSIKTEEPRRLNFLRILRALLNEKNNTLCNTLLYERILI